MPLLLTGPAAEPLDLPAFKEFLRVTHDAEDGVLALLITTARQMVESLTGRLLLTQDWRLVLDAWPPSGLILPPLGPVAGLIAARLRHADGSGTALDLSTFTVRGERAPPVIAFGRAAVPAPDRPLGGIELDLRLGYGTSAAQVPADLVQAVRLLAAHLYEHRDAAEAPWPEAVHGLLAPYRRVRL